MTKKNEKEIVVRGPSKSVAPPEKKVERVVERALEEERFGVLQISQKIGTYFGAFILASGVLLLCLFAYVTATGYVDWIRLSSEITFSSLAIYVFVGVANIVVGLLLMESE